MAYDYRVDCPTCLATARHMCIDVNGFPLRSRTGDAIVHLGRRITSLAAQAPSR